MAMGEPRDERYEESQSIRQPSDGSTGEDGEAGDCKETPENTPEKVAKSTISRVSDLRKQNAVHLLQVLKRAQEREEGRQERLLRATDKGNAEYLDRRFEVERLRDQAIISGLLQDAHAVEMAVLQGQSAHRTLDTTKGRKCPSSDNTGDRRGAGSTRRVEPSQGQGDSDSVSAEQMQYMKHVREAVDGQKRDRTRARLAVQLAAADKSTRKGAHSPSKRGIGREGLAPRMGHNQRTLKQDAQVSTGETRVRECTGSVHRTLGRKRLLEQKRNILLELKGLVGRQAEALDRLVWADGKINSDRSRGREETRHGSWSRRGGAHDDRRWGRKTEHSGESVQSNRSGVRTSAMSTLSATSICESKTSDIRFSVSAQRRPSPFPPERDATSAFLASGGRWGATSGGLGGSKVESERRTSIATSASYASYGGRQAQRKPGRNGCCRVPDVVPSLPIRR